MLAGGNFPFLPKPSPSDCSTSVRSGSSTALPLLPDVVDQQVVGDRAEHNVRQSFVDEALANIAAHRRICRTAQRKFGLLGTSLPAICKQIPWVARCHHPSTCERKRDAAGVDCDPSPAPLFSNIGCCARSTGRVQHQITWVRRHEDAARHYLVLRLHHIDLILLAASIRPNVVPDSHTVCLSKKRRIQDE